MSYYIKLTHRSPEQDFISHSDSPRFAGAKDNSIHPYQHLGPPSVLPLSSSPFQHSLFAYTTAHLWLTLIRFFTPKNKGALFRISIIRRVKRHAKFFSLWRGFLSNSITPYWELGEGINNKIRIPKQTENKALKAKA